MDLGLKTRNSKLETDMNSYLDIFPLIILTAGGLAVLCAGAFLPRRPSWLLFGLSVATILAAGAAALLVAPSSPEYLGLLDLGGYARFFAVLLLTVAFLTLLFLYRYSRERGFAGDELYALLIFAAEGMVLVAASVDWLIFFLGLELLSLCLYVLIAMRRTDAAGQEAGIKYFIMGAVASAILTFGLALLYAATGTLSIRASLANMGAAASLPVFALALLLVLVGIGFKISLVPFHLWTPDVYEGAPAPVTAFLSAGSKVSLFAILIRIALNLASPAWDMAWPLLWVLAAVTMIVGNLTAIYQTRVKRLLAYSSVAQMGYLLMALVAVKEGSLPALLFYLAVYAVMDLGAFGMLGSLSEVKGDLDELEDFQGLGYSHSLRSGVFGFCLLSLVGLPPAAGFLAKLILFWAILKAGFVILAVVGISAVIISMYYYFKVFLALYMQPASREVQIPPADPANGLAGILIALGILWLGIFPTPLLAVIEQVVKNFLG
uniref:NADH-quinone oxidoreductase subunit N n=1 Tax=Desulfobacca acetoxidans TaxID=60893 RepID=A0A7V6A5F6_9BACT